MIGTTLKLSEQLTLMISGLRDISPAAALAMEKAIKSDADQVSPPPVVASGAFQGFRVPSASRRALRTAAKAESGDVSK